MAKRKTQRKTRPKSADLPENAVRRINRQFKEKNAKFTASVKRGKIVITDNRTDATETFPNAYQAEKRVDQYLSEE